MSFRGGGGRPVAVLAGLAVAWSALAGQTAPATTAALLKLPRTERLVIPRLSAAPTLDGRSDDPAWRGVTPFPMAMQAPTFGLPPSERTEVLIGYDDAYVYVAGRLFDRAPAEIQAPTKKRDAMAASTDWFGVLFDTFNDKENALAFFTTPSGLRFDAAIFRDFQVQAATDIPMNLSWNTFWDVAVVRTGEGWFAEMRIPLSSLRFQETDGQVVMGVIAFRWISRKNETDVFPAIPKNWGEMSSWKPSQAQESLWPGLRARRPFYIAPYLLGGYDRTVDLNDAGTDYVVGRAPKLEFGLDMKVGLTSNLTLDLTANTDFAQVEADDVQVNLTRFSVFFPEKRLFFQERSSNFDFAMGGSNTLFYSRRIGLVDDRPVRIYGGGRLVGRLGGWDVGILDMQTAALGDVPAENCGVLRVRRQIVNPYSYVGAMVTNRIGTDGRYNTAYGLDAIWRMRGDDYLTLQWSQTFETGAANRVLSLDAARFTAMYERRTVAGFGTQVRFSRSGPTYDPGLGFLMFENYTAFYTRTLYGWMPGEASPLTNHDAYVECRLYWDNDSRALELAEVGPGWEFSAKSGLSGLIWPKLSFQRLDEPYELSDRVAVPPGRYAYPSLAFALQTPPGKLFNTALTGEVGGYYDGWLVTLGASPTWSVVPDLELGGMVQYNYVRFPGRDKTFVAPLGQLRVTATLSVKVTATALVQYNGADDSVAANFRFRFNPREGTDLYVVYNEGLNTARAGKFPAPPFSSGRAIYVKFTYTFNI